MLDDRNFFRRRLHFFRHFNDARQRRVALHDAFEDVAKDAFYLAVNQVIDLELVKPVRLFKLPGPRSTHDDFWLVLFDNRMGDDFNELMRVERHVVLAEDLCVNVSSVGNPERIMSVNRDYFSFRSDELFRGWLCNR